MTSKSDMHIRKRGLTSIGPGDVVRIIQPLHGVSDEMNTHGVRLDHTVFQVGMVIRVEDVSTEDRVPVALCRPDGQTICFPWVVSQIEFLLGNNKLEKVDGP